MKTHRDSRRSEALTHLTPDRRQTTGNSVPFGLPVTQAQFHEAVFTPPRDSSSACTPSASRETQRNRLQKTSILGYAASPERHVRVFKNGRNQAVRIPREFEFPLEKAIMRKGRRPAHH